MVKILIDGREHEIESGMTILQACQEVGVEVPCFCYHPRLSIAGNCRMCLVEMKGGRKPVASCGMPIAEGMEIITDSPSVATARKGVLEFLLINHPLDCPICDQGGECDLQDLTMAYGPSSSRYAENKRAVPDKNFGPIIKTHMTRCIHCTRCVRFASEIAGIPELGGLGRGEHMEISTALDHALTTELAGNLADICPVGALTSKPYAFQGRSWELTPTDSVDVLDAVGSNIRIDSRSNRVMRILPRTNDEINDDWISDKTRYAFEGLYIQRLDRPYMKRRGVMEAVSWSDAIAGVTQALEEVEPSAVAFYAGPFTDAETLMATKDLVSARGGGMTCHRLGTHFTDYTSRGDYLFNTTIKGIEKADLCLLIGTNPRDEASMINVRMRKRYLQAPFKVGMVGPLKDLRYPVTHLGDNLDVLNQLVNGTHPFAQDLRDAKKPMLILGEGALTSSQGAAVYAVARTIATTYGMIRQDWNGFNVLHTRASDVAALDLSFVSPYKDSLKSRLGKGEIKVLYLLGADDIDPSLLENVFVIYQGHAGDQGASVADIILPAAAYTEKDATYINTEGRVQRTERAVFPLGEAKTDFEIMLHVAESLKVDLGYHDLEGVRMRLKYVVPAFVHGTFKSMFQEKSFLVPDIKSETLSYVVKDFFMNDPISRLSPTMAKCHQARSKDVSSFRRAAGGDR